MGESRELEILKEIALIEILTKIEKGESIHHAISGAAIDLADSLPTAAFSLILMPGQSAPFDFINSNASFIPYAPSAKASSKLTFFNKGHHISLSKVFSSTTSREYIPLIQHQPSHEP